MATNKAYGILSKDYLSRAVNCLSRADRENEVSFLFYAAFELRCAFEARAREHVEFSERISKKKKKGWKIAALGQNIEDAFQTGDKIVRCRVKYDDNKRVGRFYYTPVDKRLQKIAKQLGDYLHARQDITRLDIGYWRNMRTRLREMADGMTEANRGTMLGPPMKNQEGCIDMNVENAPQSFLSMRADGHVSLTIDYLDQLPKHPNKRDYLWCPPWQQQRLGATQD